MGQSYRGRRGREIQIISISAIPEGLELFERGYLKHPATPSFGPQTTDTSLSDAYGRTLALPECRLSLG